MMITRNNTITLTSTKVCGVKIVPKCSKMQSYIAS